MKPNFVTYVPDKFRETYWTPYDQFQDRIGQRFTVLGHNEVLEQELEQQYGERPNLYDIVFEDGLEATVWGEEVCQEDEFN